MSALDKAIQRIESFKPSTPELLKVIEAAKQFSILAQHEYVSVNFDSGTTFALTGENAGHWVEGAPTHEPIKVSNA